MQFAPPVEECELFSLFQRHDIYVFPSLYEPFSLTLIHALAAGIPTVASDAGGNTEIVRHRRTGMLFPKGNSAALVHEVEALLRNGDLRQSVSNAARKVASKFTFVRMIDGIERCLEQAALRRDPLPPRLG